jgi:hypothetical protein
MCSEAGAARLALTHHDPLRTDSAIDEIVRDARGSQIGMTPALDIFAAAEGQELVLQATDRSSPRRMMGNAAAILDPTALVSPLLLLAVEDPVAANTIRDAAQADDIAVLEARGIDEALATAQSVQPSLIILERQGGDADARRLCEGLGGLEDTVAHSIPIILVADERDVLTRNELPVSDYLLRPFSTAYARTRLRAGLLRTACRWDRALTTHDEEQRLAALHGLGILDTPADERFDRITRLAASIFNAPMALVSLVDRDRQWFKSVRGLDVSETSRETSFCAHAISSRRVLVIPDTFQDPRFADNPLVTHSPRIRFYAGCPIFVGAHCVGTVCVLDDRPRQIDAEAISLLHDLAVLAELELSRPQRITE